MSLSWSFASHKSTGDQNDFAHFCCAPDTDCPGWLQEVENHVRAWVLKEAEHVLAFRDGRGELTAVTAFDRGTVLYPLVSPREWPSWHLQVIAVRLDCQRNGISDHLFKATFAAMRRIDKKRVFCTAYVHKDNKASLAACKAVELLPYRMRDEHFVELFGDVPLPSQ